MKINNSFIRLIIRVTSCAALFFVLFWLFLRFSPYNELKQFQQRSNSVRYYDRNGMLLQITALDGGLRREVPQEIPQYVKDVFVFSEDRRFYRHPGVDIFSLVRAFFQNTAEQRRVSGASTITMQLARIIADNADGGNTSSGLWKKTGEIFNALRLETRLSKEKILEMYLLNLPFGFNTEGAASAARTFFSSDLEMLSPVQIFALAVIPRRPGLYNPLENPQNCITAASELQQRFAANKKLADKWTLLSQINNEDWDFILSSARRFNYPFELPHLIRGINSGNVSSGRSEVRLTIDLPLQKYLEGAIAGNVTRYYSSRVTNGAAFVIDNKTGEILAWVGSADFFNRADAGQIDGVLALNQPGSSMKPFLYAMALENGFKPTEIIADIQMTFGETEIYIPRNFNERFNGPMLLRAALASSLNIPAVYLLYRLGVQNYGDLLYSLGFDSIKESLEDSGLGLALGNAPVSLLELVRAFSVFTRDGVYLPLVWETDGEKQEGKKVFSADTARLICSFLSDPNARVLAFGSARNFRTEFPAIFKTGTANQFQSIVALGATTEYSAGVWMGNFTGETVIGRTGSSIPAAVVRDALVFLDRKYANAAGFQSPENWILRRVCAVSGMLPLEACLSVIDEYLRPEERTAFCTWHKMINGRSETVFPAEYQAWFNAVSRQGSVDYSSRPLEIINPRSGFSYLSSPGIGFNEEIPAEVIGGTEDKLSVTHNGRTFTINRPFVFYLPRIKGENILRIQNGNEEEIVVFTVEH